MTVIEDRKYKKRLYDIARRPLYARRKALLSMNPKRIEQKKKSVKNWKSIPTNWPSTLLANARYRAKKYGIEFNLQKQDIIVPKICPILGIELVMGGGNGFEARDCSPSLDRIKNDIGYIRGNVAVISWRANRLKNDAKLEELEAIIKYIKEGVQLL